MSLDIIVATRTILVTTMDKYKGIFKTPQEAYENKDLLIEWYGFIINLLYDRGPNDSSMINYNLRGISKVEGNLRELRGISKRPYFAGAMNKFCEFGELQESEGFPLDLEDHRLVHGIALMDTSIKLMPEFVKREIKKIKS